MVESTYEAKNQAAHSLYMGHFKFDANAKSKIVSANVNIVQQISYPIASSNAEHFRELVDTTFDTETAKLIKQVSGSSNFLVDEFGRVTCFYIKLGNRRFPVYQPATLMFESSVQENGDLCIKVDGFQKNGTILEITGALWLARFSANLATDYNR